MAKKKKVVDSGDESPLFHVSVEKAREKYDRNREYTGHYRLVGLPIPCFAIRYLFQSTVLPLGKVIGITGPRGAMKSTLMFEFLKWFYKAKCPYAILETENKVGDENYEAMFDHDPNIPRPETCTSMDEWISMTNAYNKQFKEYCEKYGRITAMAVGLDSLTAVGCDTLLKKSSEEGVVGKRFPDEAGMLSTFFKTIPDLTYGWPFNFIYTNHYKPKYDMQTGRETFHMPGGSATEFYTSYLIKTTKQRTSVVQATGVYTDVYMHMEKNSLGADHLNLKATMCHSKERVGEDVVLRAAWDWPTTSIEKLLALLKDDGQTKHLLKEVFDLTAVTAGRVWSDALGIPKTDPISKYDAGILLECSDNALLMKEIHKATGVADHHVYVVGQDYLEQSTIASDAAVERMRNIPVEGTVTEDGEVIS